MSLTSCLQFFAGAVRRVRSPQRLLAPLAVAVAATSAAGFVGTVGTSTSAAAAIATPTYQRTIGTSGEATMYPSGVAVDPADNVYVADTGNYRIEKYQAGTNNLLWSVGVRGAPTGASFSAPRDVAADSSHVYVADTDNARVVVLNASDGSVNRIVKTFGSAGKFSDPIGISVGTDGSGNERILVSDGVSGNVYVFDTSFNLTLTVAPTAKNEGTRDAATDSAGNIYTADYRGNAVDKYSPTGNMLTHWGTTSGCQDVAKPYGVDVDQNNDVYVASSNLEQVKVFNSDGSCHNIGSTGSNAIGTKVTSPSNTGIFQLRRVAVGSGSNPLVYLADLWGLKILTYSSATGAIASSQQPELGNGTYPPAGGLNEPHDIAVDAADGYIFATNTVNQRMERFDLNGSNPMDWGVKGVVESTASFNWPQGVGFDTANGNVFVANTRNNRIDEFKTDGTKVASCPNSTRLATGFNWPMSVAFDPSGTMYVADTYNNDVRAISVSQCTGSSTVTNLWRVGTRGTGTNQFIKPWAVTYDPTQNRLLVLDTDNDRVVSLNPSTGAWNGVVVQGKGTGNGQFINPEGIAVDASGNIWVADTGNNRIEAFNSAGQFQLTFGSYGTSGNASFNAPQGLQFDNANPQNLYVADANNNRIQVYDPQTISGSGVPTYQSDIYNAGGIAPMYPAGGQANASGIMYLADSGGSRVDVINGSSLSYIGAGKLSNPRNLSIDSSNPSDLWVTDTGDNALVEMDTSGNVLQRFGASSSPALSLMSPFGNDNDNSGVYIADSYHHRVVKVSKANGSTLWQQTACGTAFGRVRDVAVGSDGNVYGVDTDHNRVVELNPSTGACIGSPWSGVSPHKLTAPRALTSDGNGGLWIADDGAHPSLLHFTDAGSYIGSTTDGGNFLEPEGVFRSGSSVVVADPFAFQVLTFSVSSGVPSATATSVVNKGGPALGGFNNPFGVAYAPNGDCFVSDMFNQRIEKFTGCTGTPIATGHFGGGQGNMQNPRGISVSPDGSTVILTNSEDERVDLFKASDLSFIQSIVPTCGKMYFPHQTAYDSANSSYWIVDTNNKRILDVSATGQCLENWSYTGAKAPRGIAWDGTNVWVADAQIGEILKCTTAGSCTVMAKRTGTAVKVNGPWNLTISGSNLYIADANAAKVVVMTLTGSPVYTFGTAGTNPAGDFSSPRSVAVNPVNGEIAVADFNLNAISFWH